MKAQIFLFACVSENALQTIKNRAQNWGVAYLH